MLQLSVLNDIVVEHARVVISHNGESDTLLNIGSGIYLGVLIDSLPDVTYYLEIYDSISKQRVTSQASALPMIDFESITPVVSRTPSDNHVWFQLKVRDELPGKNYYMINFTLLSQSRDTITDLNDFLNAASAGPPTVIFTDDELKNGIYEQLQEIPVLPSDTVLVSISNISAEYYSYLKIRERSGNIINQITGEPLTYPTNIQNGYGYFTTHFPSLHVFNLNDW